MVPLIFVSIQTPSSHEPIDAVHDDKQRSLTAMRTAIFEGARKAAVVAIGGRTSELGAHVPGLDEEVGLARTLELPIYLIGAPGGHTAHLAKDAAAVGWTTLRNGLDAATNAFIASSDEYERVARTIWSTP